MLSLYVQAAVVAPCVCVIQRVCRWFQHSVGTCIRQTGNDPDVNGGAGVALVERESYSYTRPLAVLCYLVVIDSRKTFLFFGI